jgi:hypothetical protein
VLPAELRIARSATRAGTACGCGFVAAVGDIGRRPAQLLQTGTGPVAPMPDATSIDLKSAMRLVGPMIWIQPPLKPRRHAVDLVERTAAVLGGPQRPDCGSNVMPKLLRTP